METPLPFCFQFKRFRSVCETTKCCLKVGNTGFKSLGEPRPRKYILSCAVFFTLIAMACHVFACLGVSNNRALVEPAAWAFGEVKIDNTTVKIWSGLSSIFVQFNNGTSFNSKWQNAKCEDDDEFCVSCKTSSEATIPGVIIGTITMLAQLATDLQRSTIEGDVNCQKTVATIVTSIGICSTMFSLLYYRQGCYLSLPDTVEGVSIEYDLGFGFIAMLVGTLLKGLDIFLHALVPVPQADRYRYANDFLSPEFMERKKLLDPPDDRQSVNMTPSTRGSKATRTPSLFSPSESFERTPHVALDQSSADEVVVDLDEDSQSNDNEQEVPKEQKEDERREVDEEEEEKSIKETPNQMDEEEEKEPPHPESETETDPDENAAHETNNQKD